MRKKFMAQLDEERQRAIREQQMMAAATAEQRAAREEERRLLSAARQQVAEEARKSAMAQKQERVALKTANRAAKEETRSAARRRYVQDLAHHLESRITVDNIGERLSMEFFSNPTPWKFQYIPFCAPDAPYWKENVNPLYAERQVSLQRLQDMLETERERIVSLGPADLKRLEAEGLLNPLQDNAALTKDGHADNLAALELASRTVEEEEVVDAGLPSGETVVDDSDFLFGDYDEFMDESEYDDLDLDQLMAKAQERLSVKAPERK